MRESKNFQTRPEKSEPRRSAWSFVNFDDCKKGETSAKTGCTPASGEGGKKEGEKRPKEKSLEEHADAVIKAEERLEELQSGEAEASDEIMKNAERDLEYATQDMEEAEKKEGGEPHEYSDDYLDKIKEGFSKEEWSGAMKELGSANKEGHVGEDASEYSERAGATADALDAGDKYEIDPTQENFDEMNKKFDELRQVIDKEEGEGEKKEGGEVTHKGHDAFLERKKRHLGNSQRGLDEAEKEYKEKGTINGGKRTKKEAEHRIGQLKDTVEQNQREIDLVESGKDFSKLGKEGDYWKREAGEEVDLDNQWWAEIVEEEAKKGESPEAKKRHETEMKREEAAYKRAYKRGMEP